MAIDFTVTVTGQPKGQPRARAFSRGGHARVYDPGTAEGWKALIATAVKPHLPTEPSERGFALELTFWFTRPKSHYRTGRHAGKLKASAPAEHLQMPDIDNLEKAVLDALTQVGLWRDDRQVFRVSKCRRWTKTPSAMVLSVHEVKEPT